ncbi:HNH homing endonuclease [Xanthomonas phage vB_XooS_NR08]|nr:HNH homing endonuclease [Xanthomonas phage vB_XooS_NR08]
MSDLTFEDVDKLLAYEPETGVLTWKVFRGYTAKAGSVAGCLDKTVGYIQVWANGKRYLAHRLAWLLHTGAWPIQHLDHIDGNPSNNRIEKFPDHTPAAC